MIWERAPPVGSLDVVQREAPRSYLIVPLDTRGRVIGCLALGRPDADWTEDDRATARELGQRAALLIDNRWMLRALRQELAQRTVVEQQLRFIAAQQTAAAALGAKALVDTALDEVLTEAVEIAARGLSGDASKIVEQLPDGQHVVLAASGLSIKPMTGLDADSLAAQTLEVSAPVIVQDFEAQADIPRSSLLATHAVRSAVSVPLRIGERQGTIAVLSRRPRVYSDADITFLNTIGNVASAAILRERALEAEHRAAKAERLAAVGQVASGLAHDFHNAMLAIRLYAELLQNASDLDDAGRRHLVAIRRQVELASEMVADVLDFTRGAELAVEQVRVDELIEEAANVAEAHAPLGVVVRRVRIEPQEVLADPTRLRQMLDNLINNAVQAIPHGGEITISLERQHTGPPGLAATAVLGPSWLQIDISDTGVGMDAGTLSRAREPFFTTKASGHGTGLGLAQTDRLATQHGGYLEIVSTPGKGTTVSLWLPAAPRGTG